MGNALYSNIFINKETVDWSKSNSRSLNKSNALIHQEYTEIEDAFLDQYIEKMEEISDVIDDKNLYIPVKFVREKQLFCTQIGKIELFYPKYEYYLRKEVITRRNHHEEFSEPQLWFIIFSITNGLRQLQKHNIISSPFTIDSVRFNITGQIKIDNSLTSPSHFSHIRFTFNLPSKYIVEFFVEQSYNLGLLILQLASPLLWIQQKGQIQYKYDQLVSALRLLDKKYSELLTTLVTVMLSHPNDRPLPSQIYQVFCPFKRQIEAFEPFYFNAGNMKSTFIQSQISEKKFFNYSY